MVLSAVLHLINLIGTALVKKQSIQGMISRLQYLRIRVFRHIPVIAIAIYDSEDSDNCHIVPIKT
jgi:hypothetical protein